MNVLSLFDGMSCGQIALNNLNIKVDNYFASEIKKSAIKCTMFNFPNTIQLGNVKEIDCSKLPKIDLLIGGSPCQDFSIANLNRPGLKGLKSSLFYEYVRIYEEIKPKYFLLENVIMDKLGYYTISKILKTFPVQINSKLTSAANRNRLYWTNIGPENFDLFGFRYSAIQPPKDKKIFLKDIIESGFVKVKKHGCLTTKAGENSNQEYLIRRNKIGSMVTLIYNSADFDEKKGVRTCNQSELEKLHNIPQGYTSCLNKRQAGNLIGDGWEIKAIEHIFKYLKQ